MTDSKETSHLDRLAATYEAIPHCQEMGIYISALETGKAELRLDYDARFAGNPETGVVHGGVISTLLDSVSGLSAMSALPAMTPVATLDLRIDYLKPARPGKTIIAAAECFHMARSVTFVRGLAHLGDASDPIAHCMATFMLNSVGFTTSNEGGGS